ncbi:MAG: hypothetical protein QOH26_546 [Actinomycetota bacterium]|nr:hypothetical protein [Actinomycetota bacterium]
MEIEGHPTQDMIEELERRGSLRLDGTTSGPEAEALRFLTERAPDIPGLWLFLPQETWRTGIDESPL